MAEMDCLLEFAKLIMTMRAQSAWPSAQEST